MAIVNKKIKINFLRDRKRKVGKERLLFAKIQSVAMIVLGVYSALLFSLIGVKQLALNKLDQLKNDIAIEERAILKLAPVEAMSVVVENKLALLTEFYKENMAIREAMMQLYTSMPEGVLVQSVSFGEKKDSVQLQAEAKNIFVVETLLPTLTEWWGQKKYGNIVLSGISREERASYSFSGDFELGEAAPKLVEILETEE